MKSTATGGVLGIALAILLIYWMRPLKPAAATLVTVICVGVSVTVAKLIGRPKKGGESK